MSRLDRARIGAAVGMISAALLLGLFDWATGQFNQPIPYTRDFMVGAILFGIVEVPRIERENPGWKFLLMGQVTAIAILLIHLENPKLLAGASSTALVMLFISSALITLIVGENSVIDDTPDGGMLSRITPGKSDLPYFAVAGFVAIIMVV